MMVKVRELKRHSSIEKFLILPWIEILILFAGCYHKKKLYLKNRKQMQTTELVYSYNSIELIFLSKTAMRNENRQQWNFGQLL